MAAPKKKPGRGTNRPVSGPAVAPNMPPPRSAGLGGPPGGALNFGPAGPLPPAAPRRVVRGAAYNPPNYVPPTPPALSRPPRRRSK